MKAFARFKKKFCCLDSAYVDKLAKDINRLKYFIVRQDLFERTVNAKGIKPKNCKGTLGAFLTMITKKADPGKFGSAREVHFLES